MAKAGKTWVTTYPSGVSEQFRFYYSGNIRTLQHKGDTISHGYVKNWKRAPGAIYAGKAVRQRKSRGKWKAIISKRDRSSIAYIKKKHGF